MSRSRAGLVAIGWGAAAWLAGCADVRVVAIEVLGRDGEPVRGAHVAAMRLETGAAPLPLDDAGLNEMGVEGKTTQQGWTDAQGVVRLRLAGGRAHLVQASPPPLSREADGAPFPARYRLDAEGRSLEPVEHGASWTGGMRIIR